MPMQKINLMPRRDDQALSGGQLRRYGIMSLLVIIIAGAISAALSFHKNNLILEDKDLGARIAFLDIEIKKNTDSGISDFKKRAKSLSQLLDSHLYWSRLFDFLETNALKTSRFENFKGELNEQDEVSVSFQAFAPNFYEAARQILVFRRLASSGKTAEEQKNTALKSFTVSGFNIDKEGEVSFQVNLLLNKNLLYESE